MLKMGLRWLGCLFLMMTCFLCSAISYSYFYFVPYTDIDYDDMSTEGVAKLLYKDDREQLRATNGYHGAVAGYEGYDYTTECGDKLYSPLPGTGIVTYNGRDGYIGEHDYKGEQNTMITIQGDSGEVTLFHGDYSLVKPGDMVIGGITPIGLNASIGNSTGCHSHIVWKPNEDYVPNHAYTKGFVEHTGKSGDYGSLLTDYDGVYLTVSSYRPSEGGINCDADCETMASGDKVSSWTLGVDGIRAAACPQEWPFGTKFQLAGQVYECRDRGGFINCYAIGDYDPALSRKYKTDYYTQEEHCWVDILGDSGIPFGDSVLDWSFVE